jgi:hypothetical protein
MNDNFFRIEPSLNGRKFFYQYIQLEKENCRGNQTEITINNQRIKKVNLKKIDCLSVCIITCSSFNFIRKVLSDLTFTSNI